MLSIIRAFLMGLSAMTLTAPALPLLAHHSIQAEYGGGKGPTKPLEGKVTKVRWSNPHIEIYVQTAGGSGMAAGEWVVNSHAPGLLARTYGIKPGEIKVGDSVKMVGWESQQGVPRFHMRAIAINNGPMRSTHRSSDIKELKDGTIGAIVPAPGTSAETKDEYGSNLGAGAKGDGASANAGGNAEDVDAAQAVDGDGSMPWIWLIGLLAFVAVGALVVRMKKAKPQ